MLRISVEKSLYFVAKCSTTGGWWFQGVILNGVKDSINVLDSIGFTSLQSDSCFVIVSFVFRL